MAESIQSSGSCLCGKVQISVRAMSKHVAPATAEFAENGAEVR